MIFKQLLVLVCCCFLATSTLAGKGKGVAKLNTDIFPYNFNINGKATLPQIFFFNTDKGNYKYLQPQVEKASKAGVHIYSLGIWTPLKPGADELNFTRSDGLLDKFIAIDPKAKFLIRLGIGPNSDWPAFRTKNKSNIGEYFKYADGTSSHIVSFASDAFQEPTSIQLRKIVKHFENKYPERILVYQVSPLFSEMFDMAYRQKGADYSMAATSAFRKYLKNHYQTIAALRKAWGDSKVDFSNAQVPRPKKGRWPMRHRLDERINAFYHPVKERAWIDYSEFYSKLLGDHVIRWCKVVKEETNGNKMTAAFYGYLVSLPGSFAGHFNLAEVLNSEYVDILCSPISYSDRATGGPGSFMSPVDSVILNKKLWINEDDTRTHAIDVKAHGFKPGFSATSNISETIGVIDRNISNILTHGAGIWWMDLHASGMFNSQEVWNLIKKRQSFFRNSEEPKKSYSADVQLIVDEKSKMYFADDYSFDRTVLHRNITSLSKSSATVETYLFSDYVAGKTPKAKIVVFATTYKMSKAQMSAVKKRLAKDKSHRVWCFLPGYIDGKGKYNTANIEKLTGFNVKLVPGKVASTGSYGNFTKLKFLEWYDNLDLEERPVVSAKGCQIIAKYDSDGKPSAAMKISKGIYSFYLGNPGANVGIFRSIFKTAKVHMWADKPALVNKNNKYIFVYTGKKGKITLNVPRGIKLKTIDGKAVIQRYKKVSLDLDKTGVKWFEYTK